MTCGATTDRTPSILAICTRDAGHDGDHRDDTYRPYTWTNEAEEGR